MGAPTEYREEAAELVHAGAYGPQLLEDLQHRLPPRGVSWLLRDTQMGHRGVTVGDLRQVLGEVGGRRRDLVL